MIVQSARFGPIDVDDNTVLRFEEGLPGFEELKRFTLVVCTQTEPIRWLQAVDAPSISLPVIDPFIVYPDYRIDIDEKECEALGCVDEQQLVAFCVMVIPEDMSKCTVNLSAPVIINMETNKAKQIVAEYKLENSLRYPAYEGLAKYFKEMQASAGTDETDR